MTYEEAKKLLKNYSQEHILKHYDVLSETNKQRLLDQIAGIDFSCLESLNNKETAKRGTLSPLGAVEIKEIEQRKQEFIKTGIEAIKNCKVGAVLLAGGQGTRLGSDKPKGMYNIGVHKDLFIFEQLMNNLKAVADKANATVPLYIMTSDKNHEDTVNFFQEKDYFGYPENMIQFFKQEMAPSVDYNGKIYMEDESTISLSPNGNGGWFSSMKKAGLLSDLHQKGIEWLNVFAVDNVLQKIADPAFVGATIQSGCECGAKVVKKADSYEKVGVLCLEDNRPSIVEYYEMSKEMAETVDASGELMYRFGVILNYLFNVKKLEDIVDKRMQIHVVEKKIPYMNEQGEKVAPEKPNGYKFELLVLDMIHLMDDCLSYEVVRENEFAPIKNKTGIDSVESARALLKQNGIEF